MGTGYARAATKSNSDDTPSRIISTDLPICVPTLQVSVAAVTSGIKMSSAEAITTAAPIVSTASQQATSVPTSTPLYAPPFFPMSSTSQETILPTFQQSQVFATVPNSQQGPVFPPTQISQQGLMFPTTQTFQQGPMLPTLPMSQQGPVPLDAQTFQRGSMPPAIPSSQQGPVHSTGSNSSNLLSSATDTAMQEAAALLASLSDVILSPPRPILAQSHLSAVPAMIDHGAGSVLEQNLQQVYTNAYICNSSSRNIVYIRRIDTGTSHVQGHRTWYSHGFGHVCMCEISLATCLYLLCEIAMSGTDYLYLILIQHPTKFCFIISQSVDFVRRKWLKYYSSWDLRHK